MKRLKLPVAVVERAKLVTRKSAPPPAPQALKKKPLVRAKVIAALKRLHPMD